MPWEKPSAETIAVFERIVPPAAERKKMFGCPCAFVGGNMFAGVHEHRLILRLPEDARAEFAALGARPFEPMGRPMREYMVAPPALLADEDALPAWIDRAIAYVGSLPPKDPKPRKSPARKSAKPASRRN